jgi:hypothetical protein
MKAKPNDLQEQLNDAVRAYAEIKHRRRATRVVVFLDDGEKCGWPIAEIAASSEPTCHAANDYKTVIWYGRRFSFTETQSRIVAVLWAAWEDGSRDVSQESLLKSADCDSQRLEYLFRRSPAWNLIVVRGDAPGMYRLAEPDEIEGW